MQAEDILENPRDTRALEQQPESKKVAAHIRRQLHFSLLGLSGLAVMLGILVAYGAYGFRLSYPLFDRWLHDTGHISPGLGQLLLLALGGLFFGLILKALHWQRFRGPANVIIAVGGVLAGAVGWWIPEVLGIGENTMQQILDPEVAAATYGDGSDDWCGGGECPGHTLLFALDISPADSQAGY